MKKKLLIVALGLLLSLPFTAYALFTNGEFEDGTFTGWTVENGFNSDGLVLDGDGIPIAETVTYSPGGHDTIHTWDNVTSGSGTDYMAFLLPSVKYGTHSAVVNYSGQGTTFGDGRKATRIYQESALAESDRDPDGNFYLRFSWAAVTESAHEPAGQSYFHVSFKNVTQGTTLYDRFYYSGQPGITWRTDNTTNTDWYWLDWQDVDVNISDNVAVGDILRIEASAAGCRYSGHAGHVYLDGFRSQAAPQTGTATSGFDLRNDALGNGWCGTVFAVGDKGGNGPGGPWSGAALTTLYFMMFLLPVWILKRMHGKKRSLMKPALLSFLFLLILCLAAALPASAGDLVPKAQRYHPTSDGSGTLTLDSDQPLGAGNWAFVSTLNISKRPLNRGDINNLTVQTERVHDLATLDFAAAYGFCKDFQVGIDVPFNLLLNGSNVRGEENTNNNIGDIKVNGKWQFLSRPTYGLAFVPYVIFPSGNDEYLLSEGKFSVGGKLAGHLTHSPKLTFLANLGVQQVGNPATQNYSTWIQYGVGADYKLSKKESLVAEINGETIGEKPFDHTVVSPFELLAAYRNEWTPGWTWQVGGGGGLSKGMGAPQWRAIVGVAYLFNNPKAAPAR
ncbi:MAG: hypothetical protein HY896_06435 [Deltaproteobacteria bacterium]|nr:hypothetical protein [Deltaproteobacteria bacterium]